MKTELRQHYKSIRKNLLAAEIQQNSHAICQLITSSLLWEKSKRIMCYLALPDEVQTKKIIQQAWADHKEVIIPVCTGNAQILPSLLYSFEELEPKTMGILEPKIGLIRKVDPQKIDLCLIPGIAFDLMGNRLGFGAGYYDRFLPSLRPEVAKIGLAHQIQISQEILPNNPDDIPMDFLCTETEFISIKNSK